MVKYEGQTAGLCTNICAISFNPLLESRQNGTLVDHRE